MGLSPNNLYAVTAWVSDDEKRLSSVGYYLGDPQANDEWLELSAAVAEVNGDYVDILIDEERYVDVRVEPLPPLGRTLTI